MLAIVVSVIRNRFSSYIRAVNPFHLYYQFEKNKRCYIKFYVFLFMFKIINYYTESNLFFNLIYRV